MTIVVSVFYIHPSKFGYFVYCCLELTIYMLLTSSLFNGEVFLKSVPQYKKNVLSGDVVDTSLKI